MPIQTLKNNEVKKKSFLERFLGDFREADDKRLHTFFIIYDALFFSVFSVLAVAIIAASASFAGLPLLTAVGAWFIAHSTAGMMPLILMLEIGAGIFLFNLLVQLEAPGSAIRCIVRIHEVAKAQADKSSARPIKVLRYSVTMLAGIAASALMPIAHVLWNSWYKANDVMDSLRKNGWIWGTVHSKYEPKEGYSDYDFTTGLWGKLCKAVYNLATIFIAFPLTVALYPVNIIWQALPTLPIELKLFLLAALGGLTLAAVIVASHGLATLLLAPAGAWLLSTGLTLCTSVSCYQQRCDCFFIGCFV